MKNPNDVERIRCETKNQVQEILRQVAEFRTLNIINDNATIRHDWMIMEKLKSIIESIAADFGYMTDNVKQIVETEI